MPHTSSRRRYEAYRAQLRERLARLRREGAMVSRQGTERSLRRSRGFWTLLREFLRLLGPSRRSLAVALGTLTVSTLLGLVPPAATKFAIDNVFGGAPLPPAVRGLFPASWTALDTPRGLLVALAVGMIALTAVRLVIGLWGRWLATRTVKRVQNAVRRLAFAHAADLPLHRLQSLKSGGLVSMLREDAGGVGDLVWHTLFGVEEDFEALVSPTHLLLGIGMVLVVSAPLRAAWRRPGSAGWQALAPALLSGTLLLSLFTFFMMFSHPLMSLIGGRLHNSFHNDVGQMAGVVSLMVTAAVLVGMPFLLLQRWVLPAGALTLVWGVNTGAMAIVNWELPYAGLLLGAMLAAVVVSDWLLVRAQALYPDLRGLRVFAFVAPALLFGAYFLALLQSEGTRWSIHLVGGAIFLPGVVGLLLSYLAWPPALPSPSPWQQGSSKAPR